MTPEAKNTLPWIRFLKDHSSPGLRWPADVGKSSSYGAITRRWGALTGWVSAGKALSPLHDHIWVTTAAQLQVHLPVWETPVEEVWPRPEAETNRGHGALFTCEIHRLDISFTELPSNCEFDDVGENSVQHQTQSHSWKQDTRVNCSKLFFFFLNWSVALFLTQHRFLQISSLWLFQKGEKQDYSQWSENGYTLKHERENKLFNYYIQNENRSVWMQWYFVMWCNDAVEWGRRKIKELVLFLLLHTALLVKFSTGPKNLFSQDRKYGLHIHIFYCFMVISLLWMSQPARNTGSIWCLALWTQQLY